MTHFGVNEGLAGTVIDAIDQTSDGFLWLGTGGRYLIRFDGTTFYKFVAHAIRLAAAPGNDLWIGADQALLRIPSSNFNQFTLPGLTTYHPGPEEETGVLRLRVARNGILWVGTKSGLFRYDGSQFVAIGPRVAVREIEEGPDGHILTVTTSGFIEWDGSTMVPHPGLAERLGIRQNEIFHVLRDRQGNTWYSTALGIARETAGHIEKLGTFGPDKHAGKRAYEDAQGTIWIGKDEGLFRATPSGLELIDAGMKVESLFGDRDGNLWVGTNGDGLYRFKQPAVRMFGKDDGLPNIVIQTVMTSSDGTLWTGANCGGLSRFDGTRFQTFSEKQGLLNSCVWALAEDANHDIWVGTWNGGAFRFHDGTFTQYSKKEGMADDRVTGIVAGRDGTMWFGTRDGLSRLRNGEFRTYNAADGLSVPVVLRVFEDRTGVVWIGTRQGLYRMAGDRFELFPAVPKAFVFPSGESRDGSLYVTDGDRNLNVRIHNGQAEVITGLPDASDVRETSEGDLWLGGTTITHVRRDQLAQVRARDEPFDYETFSLADGLTTSDVGSPGPNLALTKDGKLWAATTQGLAQFDLARLPFVSTKPSIYLTNVTIGRTTARPAGEIVLPAGTNHLQIDFGAVEISSPEKIRMQYRLDDVDAEWLDAGRDPHAIYSTLPIGTHLLRIRATNRTGIWDREGAVFRITQQPFFYQTRWFAAVIGGLFILLIVGVYRMRVDQIAGAMSARFDERLAERTRVARELHDTLLQTFHGVLFRLQAAVNMLPEHSEAKEHFESVIDRAAQAITEGRDAIQDLRASTVVTNDLAVAISMLGKELTASGANGNTVVHVAVHGTPRDLHPILRDDIYRIAGEALRNAVRHAHARRIEVELTYEDGQFRLQVRDDGQGMDAPADGGRGHFGLSGMRERAELIGGRLVVWSEVGTGTEIDLTIPAAKAYATVGARRRGAGRRSSERARFHLWRR
jgi:signal transduction histidine kinase/ligand-binding sensor domain-containing protein